MSSSAASSVSRIFTKIHDAAVVSVQGTPLVSCLMPTLPGREEMAKRAVYDFLDQSWPNKELILACSGERDAIVPFYEWVMSLNGSCAGRCDIGMSFCATPDGKPLSLGQMRNHTNDEAAGEWLVTWDDDDRHHPERISRHMATARHAPADVTYLNMQLHVFTDTQQIWWVDWRDFRSPGYVCYRKTTARYITEGELSQRGEDKMFLRQLDADGYKFAKVETEIPLYIRYFHGSNAWNRRHHDVLVHGHTVMPERIRSHRRELCDLLQLLQISGPLDFMCRAGVVFRYEGG